MQHNKTSKEALLADQGRFHRGVGKCLDKIGKKYEDEKLIRGLWCDIALEDEKVIIEVDGPSHFLTDLESDQHHYNGTSRAKSAFLQSLGWKVVHIAYFEWEEA